MHHVVHRATGTALLAVLVALGLPGTSATAPAAADGATMARVHDLANQCRTLRVGDRAVAFDGDAATLSPDGEPFHLEPTDLGVVLLHDREGRYLAVDDDPLGAPSLDRVGDPAPAAEWVLAPSGARDVLLTNLGTSTVLTAEAGELGVVTDADAATAFAPVPATGCTAFPEVDPGAVGEPFRGPAPDGTVRGFADTHTHVAAFLRLGGGAIHGEPFHRYGVQEALRDGAELHGPEGTADVLGNILRTGAPAGTHATDGWPSFTDWPTHDTYTHQQSYWVWLERVWLAGLRLMVVHVNADEQLCALLPSRQRGCDEMASARLQIAYLRDVERYIDAQSGGPGEGFFRIVTDPAAARRVIEDGKVAVVLGIESSKLFGCGEQDDAPECDRTDVDAGLAEFWDLGVRSLFLAHWFDNAFAGPGIFAQSEVFLNVLNRLETGHYYRVEPCPEPDMGHDLLSLGVHQDPASSPAAGLVNDTQALAVPTYGPGPHCNTKGLTDLGAYAVEAMADRGFVIETDHLSAKARDQVLDVTERIDHPVVSGHFHAGGLTTTEQFQRILDGGGVAGPINPPWDEFPATVRQLDALARPERQLGVPIATDTGGLASLPGPVGADVVTYPFTSWDGMVTFDRQRTGDRTFDVNRDGVAHYGLYADYLAAIASAPDGDHAMDRLFRSAEAWLTMWERARGRRPGPVDPAPAAPTPAAPDPAPSPVLPTTGGGVALVGALLVVVAGGIRSSVGPGRTGRRGGAPSSDPARGRS